MNSRIDRPTAIYVLCSCVLLLAATSSIAQEKKKKLTAEDVVAKHLESIGSAEARSSVRGAKLTGTCLLAVRQGGSGQIDGQATLASQGNKNLIVLNFDSPEYPYESLKFDGKQFYAVQFKPGFRTPLGQFFLTNDVIFKEGIAGGTLSVAWPFLNLQERNAKLEYKGVKKIAGRAVHALSYAPQKGSDIKIMIFFDETTFQHVRTEYARDITATSFQRIPGGGSGLPAPGGQRATDAHIKAVEEFSDFSQEDGLNLPHTYKFHLEIQSEVRPAVVDWTINLTSFKFNEAVDEKDFISD
jgi:hypothetical protein